MSDLEVSKGSMNLDQLEAVNAVVQYGSFRSAAEKLNRSQPALSATIKQLEEEFDIQIFDRSEYRPKLTTAGAAFLNVAKSTIASAQYTARVATELGRMKAETQLEISVDALISTEIIEMIVLECARPVLPVNLIIHKSILKGSYQGLQNGEIDLALGPRPDAPDELEAIHLENVSLVGTVSRRLLQEKKKPTPDFLAKHPQILVYDKRFDEPPDDLLPKNSLSQAGHKIFVPDHFTKLKLIEAGVGWGRISTQERKANPELLEIEKQFCRPLELELCLLRPMNRPIGVIARKIWEFFDQRNQRLNNNPPAKS